VSRSGGVMRCRKCGEAAVINMRHHRLALCGEHYLEWFLAQTERTILEFKMFAPQDRILVAVSGGKDSLSLWDVLLRLGYQADGLYINLGIDGGLHYSDQSHEKAAAFAAQWPGVRLHVASVREEHGLSIPELARKKHRKDKPCSVCGLVKRHTMNRVALEGGYSVLATGHNLDDEAAVLMQNVLHWQTGYLARQYPVLEEGEGLARKVKPLCRFYEREVAAYALVRGIDYIYDECPYAVGAKTIYYKELLNRLEGESPGVKHTFYMGFLRARDEGRLIVPREDDLAALHPCLRCGQPTTAPLICSFCRLWEGAPLPAPALAPTSS
jgi:uncharacterized protein (TIGR00269 family)